MTERKSGKAYMINTWCSVWPFGVFLLLLLFVVVFGNDDVQSGTFSLPFWKLKNAKLLSIVLHTALQQELINNNNNIYRKSSTMFNCFRRHPAEWMIHFACAILKFKFIQQKYNWKQVQICCCCCCAFCMIAIRLASQDRMAFVAYAKKCQNFK